MSEVTSLNNLSVLLMIGIACFSDLKTKRVSNRMILFFFALSSGFIFLQMGTSGLWWILSSLAASFVIALPFYMMKIFAGGDFKLLLAISPLLNWRSALLMILASFVWGAILGLIRVALQGELKQVWLNLKSLYKRSSIQPQQLHLVPFTFAILFGFLSQLTLQKIGWELI